MTNIIKMRFGIKKVCKHETLIRTEYSHYNQISNLNKFNQSFWPSNPRKEIDTWIEQGFNFARVRVIFPECSKCGVICGTPEFILKQPLYKSPENIEGMNKMVGKVVKLVS